MLPHSMASMKRVRSSCTKCSATSGKPLACRYAMMDCPHSWLPLIMASTWSNLRCSSASLNTYSVVSTCIEASMRMHLFDLFLDRWKPNDSPAPPSSDSNRLWQCSRSECLYRQDPLAYRSAGSENPIRI